MTTPLTFTITIAGTAYDIKEGTLKFSPKIEEQTELDFTVLDYTNAFSFQKGQQVALSDSATTIKFTGNILSSVKYRLDGTSVYLHDVKCNDLHKAAEEKTTNRVYSQQYAGVIMAGMTNDTLSSEGVTANYAIREDNTQAEFAQGTLAGTVATSNLGGDLELALAGNAITILETKTSNFSAGTLTNMTASNNAVGPSPTSAMKIQSIQSVSAGTNWYTYVKFWAGTPITIVSGRYLTYDLWIASTSPEAKIGIDLVFSDGTALRDQAISSNGQYFDDQNKSPHPGTDLSGLAVDTWYHRSFLMDNFVGKTISYAMIAIEGDKAGQYTGYVKNVTWLDSGGGNHGTFFSGSLNVNPPQQMQKSGYQTTKVTVVNTYDCSTASRVSPAYNISPVQIIKNSFLNFETTLPTGYDFNLSYSIDGGNSYVACQNNAALPGVLAGLSVSGKTVQFLQSFDQGAGADPTQQPKLNSMELVLNPSYTASKTDINGEWTTNGQWNTSGTSFSNTQAPSNILMPFGAVKNWENGDTSTQTLYGGGATGPFNPNTCYQYVQDGQFQLEVHQSTEAKSRMDFAGTWQNFQAEFDVKVDNTLMKVGFFYGTTGLSNYDGTYAYAIEIIGTTIKLFRGSNNGGASSNFAPTQIGSTATVNLTSQASHRIKVVRNGSSHQVYFDETLTSVNATDNTYTAAGYVGFRISNTSSTDGYIGTFDNFGISPTSLGGTWTSQSVSLTGASTYLNSIVQWLDVSTDPDQVNNIVESSINGGSTWQSVTNGGSIPNLTLGQSLSGISVRFRITFSANSSTVLPMMQYLTAYILGGFSSSGTRISPALSLASAIIAGNTVMNYSAVTPAGTSVVVATSPTGSGSWTNVNNGGPIAGITGQPLPSLDTFDVDSHLNYVHLQKTGGSAGTWTWDTTNSRLDVSGGANDMQLSSPVWFNTGYGYKKQLIIDHTQVVGGSDLSSFPVLVHLTDINLANVANRGLVQNINGFDIIFVNSAESGTLNFEIESYDPVAGEIFMWVSIATLSHTVDTVFYMYFGNASISTSQEAVTSVWDSNFKLIMHAYDNAASTSVNDSTSNANDGTAQQNTNLITVDGQIGRSLSYNGTSDYVNVPNASSLNTVTTLTYSFWINPSAFNQASFAVAFGSYGATIIDRNESGNTNGYIIGIDTTGRLWWWPASSQDKFSTGKIPLNQWTKVDVTYASSTVIIYFNGVQDSSQSSVTPQTVTNPLRIGAKSWVGGFFQGDIDEVRQSNIARTPGWLGTEYNNQSDPDSFYSVGALVAQPVNSNKDIDLIVDSDQVDRGGLVWRQSDASNFYGLDIYDASSNAGNTNIIQLYKVVANTKTQIGSNVVISFVRGTLHRFHVLMVGTSVKVYMDDNINTLISTTDSSLAGPGKAGLMESSGTAHFYNIRIQPQGQSLSGVNAYTRITLTSTDPEQTPQVIGLTLAALHPNIALGALVDTADYRRTYVSANADDLGKRSDAYWQIDPSKEMLFGPRVSLPAPWILTSNDVLLDSNLKVENSGDLYRNRMILTGVTDTQIIQETHPGDGASTSWSLQAPVAEGIPTISVNGQVKTIGQKGIDTGKDFYYAYGSNSLAQDSSGTLLQPFVDSFTIGYIGQVETEVVRNNTGGFPGTTTQAQYAALTGGNGIVEVVEDVSSKNLTVAAAQAYGDSLLQRYGVIGRTLTCQTNRTGLSVGQYIPVFINELGLFDDSMLITAMDLTVVIVTASGQMSMLYYWQITAVEGANLGSWQEFFKTTLA